MEEWHNDLVRDIEKERKKYKFWAKIHEYTSYAGLTISSVCGAIAALSIATKYSSDHPWALGLLALLPAIWIGIEKGLRPRLLASYSSRMETNLHILGLKIKNINNPDKDSTIGLYTSFLEDEENGYEAYMRSFDQPIVSMKPAGTPVPAAIPIGSTVNN